MKKWVIFLLCIFLLGLTTAAIEISGNEEDRVINLDSILESITNFLGLSDTPSSYTGEGTNCVKVNAGETALEFGVCGGGGGAGDKWIDGGTYIYPNSTFADNVIVNGYIRAEDWTNVSITESQITNLVHTTDTNASTICSGDEVLLGDGTCTSSAGFGGTDNGYFFNVTTSTMNANLSYEGYTGYEAGNAICNSNFTGTHFCTQTEIIDTIQAKNISNIPEWTGTFYMSAGGAKYAPADLPVNDCNGWTHGSAGSYLGNFWLAEANKGGVAHCGNTRYLACCKNY